MDIEGRDKSWRKRNKLRSLVISHSLTPLGTAADGPSLEPREQLRAPFLRTSRSSPSVPQLYSTESSPLPIPSILSIPLCRSTCSLWLTTASCWTLLIWVSFTCSSPPLFFHNFSPPPLPTSPSPVNMKFLGSPIITTIDSTIRDGWAPGTQIIVTTTDSRYDHTEVNTVVACSTCAPNQVFTLPSSLPSNMH